MGMNNILVQIVHPHSSQFIPKDAHTVYTNTRSCPPPFQKLYFRVPLPDSQPFKNKWKVAKIHVHEFDQILTIFLSLFDTYLGAVRSQ